MITTHLESKMATTIHVTPLDQKNEKKLNQYNEKELDENNKKEIHKIDIKEDDFKLKATSPSTDDSQPTVKDIVSSNTCLLYTSPSPRDRQKSRMPSSA